MIATSDQCAGELAMLGFESVQPPRDAAVYCPTLDWLKKFGEWFLTEPTAKAIPGKRDCEDMVTKFVDRASDALVDAGDIKENIGHSIGWAKVTLTRWLDDQTDSPGLNGIKPATNGVHMTAIVRCSDANWYFYEPITSKFCRVKTAVSDGVIGALLWVWV